MQLSPCLERMALSNEVQDDGGYLRYVVSTNISVASLKAAPATTILRGASSRFWAIHDSE